MFIDMYKNIETFFKENENSNLYAFRSGGGGLRVLTVKSQNNNIYGEGPTLKYAFELLEEDAKFGGRKYSDVYGNKHPHYLTGSSSIENIIEELLYQGYNFEINYKDNMFQMMLEYCIKNQTPEEIRKKVLDTKKNVKFEFMNLQFECSIMKFANNSLGTSTACLTQGLPKGYDPWRIETKHVTEDVSIEKVMAKIMKEFKVLNHELIWNEI